MHVVSVPAKADVEAAEVEGAAAVDTKIGLEGTFDEFALVDGGTPPQLLRHGHGLPSSLAAGRRFARVL